MKFDWTMQGTTVTMRCYNKPKLCNKKIYITQINRGSKGEHLVYLSDMKMLIEVWNLFTKIGTNLGEFLSQLDVSRLKHVSSGAILGTFENNIKLL